MSFVHRKLLLIDTAEGLGLALACFASLCKSACPPGSLPLEGKVGGVSRSDEV